MSISCGAWLNDWRAGAAAAPVAVIAGAGIWLSAGGVAGSGSRMSAPSPRPKAFLGIGNYLLGELRIALGPFTMYIIENNRLTKAWRFSKTNIAWNDTLKNLRSKEAAEIGRNLPGQGGSLVVHRKQDPLDFQIWVDRKSVV